MTSIIFDYPDIRSRMLGEDKPERKPTPGPIVLTTGTGPFIYGASPVTVPIKPWPTLPN